jgi:hypothetical protein
MCKAKVRAITAVVPQFDEYDLTLAIAIGVAAVAITLALI